MPQALRERIQIDEVELQSRRAFFELEDGDLRRLAALRPLAEQSTHEIVEDLYLLLLEHPESRKLFVHDGVVQHVKQAQREYFLGLFAGRCDLGYVEDRLRIGIAHERVGVPPKWYLGAYARYMRSIFSHLSRSVRDPAAVEQAFLSASKLVAFDMALAMDTYIFAKLDTIAHHQAAIREMSTPVIRIHDRVLLLPLVGLVDSERAAQLTETVLQSVVEQHALVVIIDIAGVPIVDSAVAQHLITTARAMQLLGARTILCGISPAIAESLANLAVDLSAVDTRHQLAEGLERAFELTGKRVVGREAPRGAGPSSAAQAVESGRF